MTRPFLRAAALAAAAAWLSGCAHHARRAAAPVPEAAKAIVRTARTYLPEEDRRRPTPLDCSDFVGRVYRERGIRLPRTSEEMSERGTAVDSSRDLRMGDLLFFAGSGGGSKVGHVAIYVNNGIFIHQANPGEGVRMESLYSDYWRKRYLKARRIVD